MRLVAGWPVAVALLAAACGTAPTPASDALAGAIVAYEETEGGELVALPSSGIAEVDVNSRVVLKMDADTIARSAPPDWDDAEVERITTELTQLNALLERLARMLASLDALRASADPSPEQLRAHGAVELEFLEALDVYLRQTRQDPDAADRAFSEPGYAGIQRYLEQVRRDHDALMGALDARRWRVRASLRSGQLAVPVHVTNYDSIDVGPLDVRNKLVPAVDEKVQREMEQARKLAATVENLDGFTRLLEAQAKERVAQLVARLESLARDVAARIGKLQSVQSSAAAANTLVASVRALEVQGEASVQACKDAVEGIQAVAGGPSSTLVSAALAAAKGCAGQLKTLGKLAAATRDGARALANRAALRGLVDEVTREAEGLLDLDASVSGLTRVLGLAKKPLATPAWGRDSQFQDRRVGEIVDGRVDLTRTERDVGDHLTFQGLLLSSSNGTVLVEGPPRDLEVVQNGLQLNVSGALLFLSPFDRADNEDDFRALPALSGAFHFRCSRDGGAPEPHGACALWNFIDPGLGASIVTVTLGKVQGGAAEGVATPHPSPALVGRLFGDVVQGGVGYDFMSSRAYWFVGLGIQTLTDLGFTSDL
jgi:hypothetical protein